MTTLLSPKPADPVADEERRLALRRLGYIEPDNASKILRHDRYWTALFVSLYMDMCERRRLEAPEEACRLARLAPDLVERVGVGSRPGQFAHHRLMMSRRAQAWTVFGECCRVVGFEEDARNAFRRAGTLCAKAKTVSARAIADLRRRRAVLLLESGQREAGHHELQLALELLRRIGEACPLAETLLVYGVAHRHLPALAEALARVDRGHEVSNAVFDTCLVQLDEHLGASPGSSPHHEDATRWLRQARRRLATINDPERRLGLLWIEGRLLADLGIGRLAERRLMRAWRGFVKFKRLGTLALVTLDLVQLDLGRDDRASVRQRIESTRPLLDDGESLRMLDAAANTDIDNVQLLRRRLSSHLERPKPPRALLPRLPSRPKLPGQAATG